MRVASLLKLNKGIYVIRISLKSVSRAVTLFKNFSNDVSNHLHNELLDSSIHSKTFKDKFGIVMANIFTQHINVFLTGLTRPPLKIFFRKLCVSK